MKDLCSLYYFSGIKVAPSPKGYLLFQSKYMADIFECAHLIDNNTVDTLLELNARYKFSMGQDILRLWLLVEVVFKLVWSSSQP